MRGFFFFLLISLLCGPSTSLAFPLRFSEQNETIVSPEGTFEMGIFRAPKSRWYLGIWYKNSPSRVIWVGNRDTPLSDPVGILTISKSRLVFLDQDGGIVWEANSTDLIFEAVVPELLDNGNFVVRNSENPVKILWQSFDFPSDTLLPGMNFSTTLISWADQHDPSFGYYRYESGRGQLSQSIVRDIDGIAYRIPLPSKEFSLGISRRNASFSFLKLAFTGTLQLWERRGEWKLVLSFPEYECELYNVCQTNSYCETTIDEKWFCNCIQGYQREHTWAPYGETDGCLRTKILTCIKDDFLKMQNMKLPDSEWATVNMEIGLEECKKRCLRDCNCTAYANVDTGNGELGCVTWIGDLLDLRRYNSGGQDLYIKSAAVEDPVEGSSMSKTFIVLIVASCLVVLAVPICLYICRRRIALAFGFQEQHPDTERPDNNQRNPHIMDFETISRATDYFSESNKIGEGGFGSVYRGRLRDGTEIAVKRLNRMTDNGITSFNNEVDLIGLVQHINIIRLIGSLSDEAENQKFLVYEYLPNLELERYIFDTTRETSLDWRNRFNIAVGIARGLVYLHEDSRFKIIHLDIKPSNILLSQDMIPKISDFGMAKTLEKHEEEKTVMIPAGTRGYMAPEYISDNIYSDKSDVFSFGVLLLEMVSGRKNTRFAAQNEGESLLSYIWKKWNTGCWLEIVDPVCSSESLPEDEVLRCIKVGLLCVQPLAGDRPTMRLVLSMLGSEILTVNMPKPPVDYSAASSSTRERSDGASTSVMNRITLSRVGAR